MKLTDLVLLSLQTAYMQKDLTTKGMCAGLQGQIREAAANTYNILMYQALNTLGDTEFAHSLVDELAWQFHCDYYDKSADIEIKKGIVKQSIQIHQKKGTPQAIIDLLTTAFPSDTLLLEWFDYNGEPYHFKVVTSDTSAANNPAFMKALNSVKNARSYLDGIEGFTLVMHHAINNIKRNLEIEYRPNEVVEVGGVVNYVFPNGDTVTFGDENLSFIEGVG